MEFFLILTSFVTIIIPGEGAKIRDRIRDGFWGDWWGHHHEQFYRSCYMKTEHSNTVLFNPNYPQPFAGGSRCSYPIHRSSHRICQIRIDFEIFSLAQPTGDGECVTDYFTVESGATFVPRICGENSGGHVYADFSEKFPLTVIVATTATKNFNRKWQLKVSQIKCSSHLKAPSHCLQYHLEPTGFIRSFNYAREENGNFNSLGVAGSRQLANLNYNICVHRQLGMCSIIYTRPLSDPYAFTMTNDVKSIDPVILGTSTLQSQTCTNDYIDIPSPSQIINGVIIPLASDRFCGLGIGEIYSQFQPFNVRAVTDLNETPDVANRGFYLNYRQGKCILNN